MPHADFRFYEELNDFLKAPQRKRTIHVAFQGRPTVRSVVTMLGVPPSEIDLVLVNGRSVGFDHRLGDGDRVAVYPVFEALDITPLVRLRPRPLRRTAFILDVHLGRLARGLRLLGFDSCYRNDFDDPDIIQRALREHRIILTRDRGLLQARAVRHGYWVRACDPEAQIMEVLTRFDLLGMPGLRPGLLEGGALHASGGEGPALASDRTRGGNLSAYCSVSRRRLFSMK